MVERADEGSTFTVGNASMPLALLALFMCPSLALSLTSAPTLTLQLDGRSRDGYGTRHPRAVLGDVRRVYSARREAHHKGTRVIQNIEKKIKTDLN